jgi:hypothetical protein
MGCMHMNGIWTFVVLRSVLVCVRYHHNNIIIIIIWEHSIAYYRLFGILIISPLFIYFE